VELSYNLLKKGLYVTKKQAQAEMEASNYSVDFDYILKRYASIPDSAIEVSESELKKYYNDHLDDFKQETSRDIEYVTFDVVPSDEDRKNVKEWINKIKEEFPTISSAEAKQYVTRNSDVPFDEKNYKKEELSDELAEFAFNAKEGDIHGPYAEDDNFKVHKLHAINYLPDSVKARHILIQNEPCRIVEYEKSKPGKHGSAKARIVAIGILDGVKRNLVSPVSARVEVPMIEKRNAQIISLADNSVQLMDLETYEVFYTALPSDNELKSKVVVGLELEYWKVLDRIMITRVKGSI